MLYILYSWPMAERNVQNEIRIRKAQKLEPSKISLNLKPYSLVQTSSKKWRYFVRAFYEEAYLRDKQIYRTAKRILVNSLHLGFLFLLWQHLTISCHRQQRNTTRWIRLTCTMLEDSWKKYCKTHKYREINRKVVIVIVNNWWSKTLQ